MKHNFDASKKYGVVYAHTNNIGDDIQTMAGINYLCKKGIKDFVCVDREYLHTYFGEPLDVVMNGWFMHLENNFPPSDKINPIYISIHIAKETIISKNLDHFKKYQPIGCRDGYTVELFQKYDIDAYFTGCLTLLFDPVKEKTNKKYLVDINSNCKYIPNIIFDKSKYQDFEIIEHDIDENQYQNIKDRLKHAEYLLNKYCSAKLVITSRLHCILPCRAFNTDAIFIHADYDHDKRFKGLKKIINGDHKEHGKTSCDKTELERIRNNLK
tara:strand:- start:1131 stop:1937 length:807 start_codon:yes stop_codon:yes gene_type:complete